MAVVIEGSLIDAKGRYAIVAARFNEFIVGRLVEGAIDTLQRHGASPDSITVVRVPGAYEIPLVCQKLAQSGSYDAVLALGAVIRGSTPHFDYVASEVSKGVAQASWQSGVPVIFGVLTTDTLQQALERAGIKSNLGWSYALQALEMGSLMAQLPGHG